MIFEGRSDRSNFQFFQSAVHFRQAIKNATSEADMWNRAPLSERSRIAFADVQINGEFLLIHDVRRIAAQSVDLLGREFRAPVCRHRHFCLALVAFHCREMDGISLHEKSTSPLLFSGGL